ncbi:MAG: hypothetical protein ACKVX7_17375 [Planctomycetota bacterium]
MARRMNGALEICERSNFLEGAEQAVDVETEQTFFLDRLIADDAVQRGKEWEAMKMKLPILFFDFYVKPSRGRLQ